MKEKFTKKFRDTCLKNSRSWFNEQLSDLMKKRDSALKIALKSKSSNDRCVFEKTFVIE